VAAFAGDSEHQASGLELILRFGRGNGLRVTDVAFNAARQDRTRKIGGAVAVAGTVDPGIEVGPVRNRKLKKKIVLPVKISLAGSSGADNDVDFFGAGGCWRRIVGDCGLIKTVGLGVHAEKKSGIGSFENVL